MVIGLTGGIGSGKTTIAQALQEQGFFVFFTDIEAKRIILQDTDVRQALMRLLGDDIYEGDRYRSDLVASRVFSDPALLRQMNAIVHPAVHHRLESIIADFPSDTPFVIESAILYESGLNSLCDYVAAVTAPVEIRLQRVMQRDHTSPEKVMQRIRNQMSDEELTRRADLVLCNDGSLPFTTLANRVCQAWLTKK